MKIVTMKFSLSILLLISAILIIGGCLSDDSIEMTTLDLNDETPSESFDRSLLLSNLADNIIIPAFEDYNAKLQLLNTNFEAFAVAPSLVALSDLRNAWLNAYKGWQYVAMYELGKAEEIGLRSYTNIFPTDTEGIQENIASQNYNLVLPSNFDKQGFPALDYLLFGDGLSDDEVLLLFENASYKDYTGDLISRLNDIASEVLDDWRGSFRDSFIDNSGSSATSSTDKMVNDFIFHYEKFFRAGKIGIPAGVFSGSPLSKTVEAPYSGVYSKALFLEAFDAIDQFFHGIGYSSQEDGIGLDDYLTFVMDQNNTSDIQKAISDQWAVARSQAQNVNDNFRTQIEDDHIKMLEVYDELQKALVFIKVDMLQALNIQVDFVDADGD